METRKRRIETRETLFPPEELFGGYSSSIGKNRGDIVVFNPSILDVRYIGSTGIEEVCKGWVGLFINEDGMPVYMPANSKLIKEDEYLGEGKRSPFYSLLFNGGVARYNSRKSQLVLKQDSESKLFTPKYNYGTMFLKGKTSKGPRRSDLELLSFGEKFVILDSTPKDKRRY